MKVGRMVLLAGITGTLTSVSVFAVPLNLTFNGGAPSQDWGYSFNADYGFKDIIPVVNQGQNRSVNLAGVNSITMTWNAPAGYMYVVNPPPAGIAGDELEFEAEYGSSGDASSLGSITASGMSIHTVSGTSPLSGAAILNAFDGPALYFEATGGMNPNSAPFAFTSLSIWADFSGLGADTTLNQSAFDAQAGAFAALFADFPTGENGYPIAPSDPGPLITLEPLPSATTPDDSSTLGLAGLGFAGLMLFGRKRFLVNN